VTLADISPHLLDQVGAADPLASLEAEERAALRARTGWLRAYARRLVVLDGLVLLLAGLVGVAARFVLATPVPHLGGMSYLVGSLSLVPVWLAVLSLSRCYEPRFLGNGSEEFKRVAHASLRVAAVVLGTFYLTRTEVSRSFLVVALSTGLVGVVAERYAGRLWLHRQRRRGQCMHKVVVVGPTAAALEMTTRLQASPLSGLQVVGACVHGDPSLFGRSTLVPVLGQLTEVVAVLEELHADTVVVAHGPGITQDDLRQLSYELEGTGVDLFVSPRLTNVTGSRISWRTLPGLPLLHVEEPELRGARQLVKLTFDRLTGLALLIVASFILVPAAIAIRLTSAGPAFFVQERVGQSGRTFRMWKLRTMYVDAEARRAELAALNVHAGNGVLFKIHDDPRVTPIGRFLRRYSLDELPQLLNVVAGHMSLVGPRPPLADEVARYESEVHRRLLVKPGMTGLWQVSGRSDLAWEEAVRLDLHYVENWSLGLDVAIICKTLLAVLKPSGAY
jgi:exopolysaccharide biosynthesis polyprenyl glycosylphosphotransferase